MASSSASVKTKVRIENICKGTILMWSGSQNTIPPGWHLCDGSSGTIDLRNRFVIGSDQKVTGSGVSSTHPFGSTGGQMALELTSDNMPNGWPTISDPGHGHGSHLKGELAYPIFPTGLSKVILPGKPANPGVPITVDTNTTGVTIPQKGTGKAFNNTPAYYSIYYIQKL